MGDPMASVAPAEARASRSAAPPPSRGLRQGCLHLCNGLDPVRDGGMVPSILGMAGALAAPGRGGVDRDPDSVAAGGETDPTPDRIPRARGRPRSRRPPGRGRPHARALAGADAGAGAHTARVAGVPYLIAAHGMAEPWAMRHKAWKKRVYTTALVEGKNLRRAACLHALSRADRPSARATTRTPICFVPNGVDLEPFGKPTRPFGPRGGVPRAGGQVCRALLGPAACERGARSARPGDHPAAPRPPRPSCAARRQRRRGGLPVPRAGRRRGPVNAGNLGRPCLGRTGPPGLGHHRHLHPAQLQ